MIAAAITWHVARAGGIVAWALLSLALVWGLLLSSRVLGRRSGPAWLLAVHRHVGGLAAIFTAVHVGGILADEWIDFGLWESFVPMAATWKPGAVAWGIVGLYLLIAIEITSLAMRFLPKGLWRAVHWSSGALFVVATMHGWQAGTDAGKAFMCVIVGVCVVLGSLTIVRIRSARRPEPTANVDRRAALAKLRGEVGGGPVAEGPDPGPKPCRSGRRSATHHHVVGRVRIGPVLDRRPSMSPPAPVSVRQPVSAAHR